MGRPANPVLVGFDLIGPVSNQGSRDSTLVIVVLILAEGDVVEVGPALSDKDIGVGVARVLALVAPLDPGFGIAPVICEKQDQGIVEFVPFAERIHELAHVFIDLLDHGGVDGHHVVVAFFLLLAK